MRNGETRDGRNARLKDEGRFGEFNERVEVLKRGATTKCETQLAYWRAVAEYLPLLDAQPGPADNGEHLIDPAVFTAKPPTTQTNAIRWVSDSIGVAGVEPKDAPTPAAAALLIWCRRNPANEASFWSKLYPLILPTRATLEAADARFGEKNPLLEELFEEGMKKIAAIGLRITESWWVGLHPRLVNNPKRWRELKAYVDGAIARGETLTEPISEPVGIAATPEDDDDSHHNGRRDAVPPRARRNFDAP